MSIPDKFAMAYKMAATWKEAEERNDTKTIQDLDFGVAPCCFRCKQPCFDRVTKEFKAMRCGGCQGIIYCGRACQKADWKQSIDPRVTPHKGLCAINKEHMKRIPYFQAEFKQFPWSRIETDGSCSHDVLKARFGVLGSDSSFGYWSQRSDNRPHDDSVDMKPTKGSKGLVLPATRPYMHGEVLLAKEWPDHGKAWKLKDVKHIPLLSFPDETLCPHEVEDGEVKDWASWYKWRGLPLTSPAAMLMDYPLSVYHLLLNVLKVVDPHRSPSNRQELQVHYLGAELELNFIPLFSELALLLPNTDITLTLFGKVGADLVKKAKANHPNSLAAKDTVWSYTAPKKSGGGTIKVNIYHKLDDWGRLVPLQDGMVPDAMVGLNAGLMSYQGWGEPLMFSAVLDIPFAVTDYMEQIMETTASAIPTMRQQYAKNVGDQSDQTEVRDRLLEPFTPPITVNPFHRPGQRPIAVVRMPNLDNGFCIPLVLKNADGPRFLRDEGGKVKSVLVPADEDSAIDLLTQQQQQQQPKSLLRMDGSIYPIIVACVIGLVAVLLSARS